jgi:two-component system, sensor histidine kinase LadS
VKAFLLAFLLLASHCGQHALAQTFDRLYADSAQPKLALPLQWLAVPKQSKLEANAPAGSPAVFPSALEGWPFEDVTPRTQLPTSTTQNVWMRFTLAPTTVVETWYLRFPRVNLVKATLFTPDTQGAWQPQVAGNAVAPAQWPLRTRAPTFELKTSTTAQSTFYICFENQSVMSERLQMLSTVQYITGAYSVGAVLGVMVGTFSLLAFVCVAAYALARNTVFLWLAAFVVVMLFTQLVLLGFAGWQFWPGSQHLNQNMPWAASLLALASGTWLVARASYAQDTHPRVYQLLGGIALASLLIAAVTVVDLNAVPRNAKNIWAGSVVVLVMGAMAWLTLRGNQFNGVLLLGVMPIGLAALNRVAYNVGWLAHVEVAQMFGMFGSVFGLLLLFSALVWRSRAQLQSNKRSQIFSDYDAETGLLVAEKAKTRLPRLLLRGSRLKLGSGVMLLRWVDAPRYAGLAASAARGQILQQLGNLMRAASRDIDSLIRHDENHFLMLLEGPISRDALSATASQIMAAALRGAEPAQTAGAAHTVNLHIAIWHETMSTTSANNVMALLTRRLNTMGKTTQRRVQFTDSNAGDEVADSNSERNRRKQELLDKIREIEGEPTQKDMLL